MSTRNIGGSILPSSSPQVLSPITTPKGVLQVREMFHLDTHGLFVDSRLVAMHPNGYSCRSLAEYIASGDVGRVRQQAQYILDCGGMTIAVEALVWYAESATPLPMREDPRYRGTDFRSAIDVDRASQGGGK